ncbi:MAG TPA: M42 family metallopeptidase [Anaerolineaceae bacterium]|nr:M42 family metallopeptidase [Anaerolineaceae bacterium]
MSIEEKKIVQDDALLALIKKMVETPGPSGQEQLIRAAILEEIQGSADEIRTDAMGNLIARKGSKQPNGLCIMISAHMDEIGLMVTHVDEDGFARFIPIGGVSPLTCIGGRVIFMNGQRGVIGCERLEPNQLPTIEKLFIDVGATSRDDCPVKVGDVCGFERPFLNLGKHLVAKSMDNRISTVVAIQALKALKDSPHEVYFVFSVQEEVGLRGSATAAYGLDPDLGLAVDVTRTGDTPRTSKMEVALDKGPAVKVRDSSFIADPRVVDWMAATAKAAEIPYQMEVLEAGGTDGRSIQLARAGVPAGCLSIPCRYIHSPSEMVSRADVENAIRLLVELLSHDVKLG